MLSRILRSGVTNNKKPLFSSILPPQLGVKAIHNRIVLADFIRNDFKNFHDKYDNSANNISNKSLGLMSIGVAGVAGLFLYGIGQSVNEKASTWSPEVRLYLRKAYLYVLSGVATASATCLYVLKNNPNLMYSPGIAIGGFVASLALIFITSSISYDRNFLMKNLSFLSLCALIGLSFTPAGQILGKEALSRAAMLTTAVVGGVSLAGICAPDEKFLWLGGPLFMGLLALIGVQFATMLFPAKMLPIYRFSLYPAVGLFGLMLLYDTQRMIYQGKIEVAGYAPYDPVNSAMKSFITITNLFSSILSAQKRK